MGIFLEAVNQWINSSQAVARGQASRLFRRKPESSTFL